MSTFQWQFSGLEVSFDPEDRVPSYISFEPDVLPPPAPASAPAPAPLYNIGSDDDANDDSDDDDIMLSGGARRNWENIHTRYRVVATGEITEDVVLNAPDPVQVDFEPAEPRNGNWALGSFPLPRQVVQALLGGFPDAQAHLNDQVWRTAVNQAVSEPRGFAVPLQCSIEGAGDQKWVVKRMRDIGMMTAAQAVELETSKGRLRTNMFWLAQRMWEFVRALMGQNNPALNAALNNLLDGDVLNLLLQAGLPVRARDVLPRQYERLFSHSWLQGGAGPAPEDGGGGGGEDGGGGGGGDGGSEAGGDGGGGGGSSSRSSILSRSTEPEFDGSVAGAAGEVGAVGAASAPSSGVVAVSPVSPVVGAPSSGVVAVAPVVVDVPPPAEPATGGRRARRRGGGQALPAIAEGSGDELGEVPLGFAPGDVEGVEFPAGDVPIPVGVGSRAPSIVSRVPSSAFPAGAARVVNLDGGENVSTETGLYSGVQRWGDTNQSVDRFRYLGSSADSYLIRETDRLMQKYEAIEGLQFIGQELRRLRGTRHTHVLFPIVYLLQNDMYIDMLDNLTSTNRLRLVRGVQQLVQVCQGSLLSLKPNERLEAVDIVEQRINIVDRQDPSRKRFTLNYNNNQATDTTTLSFNVTPTSFTSLAFFQTVSNYLPYMLYEVTQNNFFKTQIKFLVRNIPEESNIYKMLKAIFGASFTLSKEELRRRLRQLQADLGLYKLNDTPANVEQLVSSRDRSTAVVINLKRFVPGRPFTVDDVETWITGSIVSGNTVRFTLEQTTNRVKVPWSVNWQGVTKANRTATNFAKERTNHLRIDLICRQKLNVQVQSVGFCSLLYYLGEMRILNPGKFTAQSMVFIELSRLSRNNTGLPDPVFAQLLHERFKFQRTFDFQHLLSSNNDQQLKPIRDKLSAFWNPQMPPPFVKKYKAPLTQQTLTTQFVDLKDLDNQFATQNVEGGTFSDENQSVLQRQERSLTMARPYPSDGQLLSIFYRMFQDQYERQQNLPKGQATVYAI